MLFVCVLLGFPKNVNTFNYQFEFHPFEWPFRLGCFFLGFAVVGATVVRFFNAFTVGCGVDRFFNGLATVGLSTNGFTVDGLAIDGFRVDRLGINVLGVDCLSINGLAVDGFAIINGRSVDGLPNGLNVVDNSIPFGTHGLFFGLTKW